jgi:Flp pilus assembly protein TadD
MAQPNRITAVPLADYVPKPSDDYAVFARLAEFAHQLGRADLAEEFRHRAGPAPEERNEHVPESILRFPGAPASPGPDSRDRVQAARICKAGLRLLRANNIAEALEKFREALTIDSKHHDAHANMGVALGRQGQRPEAEQCFREALKIRPDYPPMYGNLGTVCLEQNKLAEAEAAFQRAIELDPKQPDFKCKLGNVLEARKQVPEAEAAYRAAISLKPKEAEYHFRLGKLLSKAGRFPEAESSFRETTRLKPDKATHWIHLGGALDAQGQSGAAETVYRVAVGLEPKNAEIHNNLGVSLAAQNRAAEAEASYRRALELNPRLAMIHNNLGNNLRTQDRLPEAEASLKEAIRLQPRYAEAHNNLGIVYIQQRRIADGLASYEEALRLKPEYAEAHLNRSLMWLASGDFARGWPEYEWRFKMKGRKAPTAPCERWDGSPLNGRTLLLRAEQGLGDLVQFMRYAALIPRGKGGKVILECPEGLMDLAQTCPGIDQRCVRGQALPPCDLYCAILTVPGLMKTTLETVPADIPYISVDPARIEYWEKELDSIPGRRVGISWQGSLEHRGDRLRSIPLARFAALAKVRGLTLCSIQKGHGSEQLIDGSAAELKVQDWGSRTAASFADTAALMHALDLVLTVDTAVAHVAGALGIPVWVMLPCASDWRWLHEREDSPWYPTMRLFRQPRPGDWDSVFSRIVTALNQWPDRLRRARSGR